MSNENLCGNITGSWQTVLEHGLDLVGKPPLGKKLTTVFQKFAK